MVMDKQSETPSRNNCPANFKTTSSCSSISSILREFRRPHGRGLSLRVCSCNRRRCGITNTAARRPAQERLVAHAWRRPRAVLPADRARVVQLICPLLFTDGTQWVVSGGVVFGYGWTLFRRLRQNLKAAASGVRV